jgi:hypothetical protein
VIGNLPWTESTSNEESDKVSVRLRGELILAQICELVGSLSANDEKLRLGSGFIRLKKLAGSLRQRAQEVHGLRPSATEAKLVLGKDYRQTVNSLLRETKNAAWVRTADLEQFSRSGLLAEIIRRAADVGDRIDITYGKPRDPDAKEIPEIATLLKSGARPRQSDNCRANLLSADSRFSILLGDLGAPNHNRSALQIGVAIRGSQPQKFLSLCQQ